MLHLDNASAGAQERIVGKVLHGKHRPAWHFELTQYVDRFELSFVGEPFLDVCKDVEDVWLAGVGRSVCRIFCPFRFADRLAGTLPVLFLDREIDVSVRVSFPALALEYPTRLPAAAGVASARDRIAKRSIRILRVFFQVTKTLQA